MSRQIYNQPTSTPSSIGANAQATPIDGRTSVSNDLLKLATKDIQIIGVHLGYIIGTFQNKDGSGGLFITDGSSTFNIDENRTIHIQTGKTAIDGGTGGGIQFRSDWINTKTGQMTLEIEGNDDESTQDSSGVEKTNPAFSLKVYGDVSIQSVGGDVAVGGKNIKFNAEDQIELTAGSQLLVNVADGSGKIDFIAGEVNTKSKFATFDLSGSFYVNGPPEITFNQKVSVDPISGSVKLTPVSATRSTNTVGNINDVIVGSYSVSTLFNYQIDSNKFLSRDVQGSSILSLGPMDRYTLAQVSEEAVGTPRENSRDIFAYKLNVGGSIGTSYVLNAGAVRIDSVGSVDTRAVAQISSIGTVILLN